MKLSRAASFFNRTEFVDAYSGALVALGQLQPYTDNTRDSATAQRRTASLGPGFARPLRGVVSILGDRYVMGNAHTDVHRGEAMRSQVTLHLADLDLELLTFAKACTGAAGRHVWGNTVFVKDAAFTEQTSELTPIYQGALAAVELDQAFDMVRAGQRLYLVRSVMVGAAGIGETVMEELVPEAVQAVTVHKVTFDQVAGQGAQVDLPATAIFVRWQALFRYGSAVSPRYSADSRMALLSSSIGVKVGDLMTNAFGTKTRVTSVTQRDGVDICSLVIYED